MNQHRAASARRPGASVSQVIATHMGEWGALEANKGVLVSTDGRSRRLPAPVRRDEITVEGDGWSVKAARGMGDSRRRTARRL